MKRCDVILDHLDLILNFEPSKKAKNEVKKILKLKQINVENVTQKDWFRYEGLMGGPRPISWQGWICCGIFFSSVFLSALIVNLKHYPSIIAMIILAISLLIFMILAMIKSNYRKMLNAYKAGL